MRRTSARKRHYLVAYAVAAAIALTVTSTAFTAIHPLRARNTTSVYTKDVSAREDRSRVSAVYWGAYIEGSQSYSYLYGGTWSNGPWHDPGTRNAWGRFEQNAGKQVS